MNVILNMDSVFFWCNLPLKNGRSSHYVIDVLPRKSLIALEAMFDVKEFEWYALCSLWIIQNQNISLKKCQLSIGLLPMLPREKILNIWQQSKLHVFWFLGITLNSHSTLSIHVYISYVSVCLSVCLQTGKRQLDNCQALIGSLPFHETASILWQQASSVLFSFSKKGVLKSKISYLLHQQSS